MNLSVVRAATTASVAAAITASAAPSLLQRQQQRLSGSPSGIQVKVVDDSRSVFHRGGESFLNKFFPSGYPYSVNEGYLRYTQFQALQHFSSAALSVLSTQSLLFAAGLRPTPAQAAAVSWILRDGMQHAGKLICSNFGARMDSEPKRWRILADVLYDLDTGLEVLSLLCPHLFLEVAGLGNFAKGMALVAARATRLPIYSSFAKEGNLSDLFAKGEAISTVFNVIGMGAWIQLAPTICSSIEGKDVIKVSLESSVIPRVQLAEGLLIRVDPLCEIDGVPIGPEYCKVFVLKANKPNAVLETTSQCLRTVGEAVGRYILWRSIHVQPF